MSIFGKPIDHNHDAILTTRWRQALNEIHGYALPCHRGNRQRLEQSRVASPVRLGLLTGWAGGDKLMNARLETMPRELLFDSVVSSRKARMSPNSRRMELVHDAALQRLVIPNP
jgi:hypothetical protein